MSETREIRVPDIGDFEAVEVIEVLVAVGQRVAAEESLVTLESDKATMEVPSPAAGTVREVRVAVGDSVSQGSPILVLESDAADTAAAPAPAEERPRPQQDSRHADAEVLVLGAGPGGYTAAFRAADLGKRVVLVEASPTLGGVCLNVGCIPSKALLHAAQVIEEAAAFAERGIAFGRPEVDPARLVRWWKEDVVKRLTDGLAGLAEARGVELVQGRGRFLDPHRLTVATADGERTIRFRQAIIAAGSRPTELPGFPHADPRVLDSTSALDLPALGGDLLVIGGGIIGLEMATFYHALGTRVSVAVRSGHLLSGLDPELVRPLLRRIRARWAGVYLDTRIREVAADEDGLTVHFEGDQAPPRQRFDHVLVAVGRRPNGDRIGVESAGVALDERGFIRVDAQQRTNVPHIFAIGDIVGDPMLAHKASHQGRVAAEVAAGERSGFDVRVIPSVAYTDPEIAWAGVTETEARTRGIDYGKGVFPWSASGRSLSLGRSDGLTKVLFDRANGRTLGVGIVGPNAGELIAEGVLACELGADAEDIALSIHPHPTLSETIAFAADAYLGTITDLYLPKT